MEWRDILSAEKEKEYFKKILAFIENERTAGKTIYPKNSDIFNAFTFTPFDAVKVVIVGQDPYHGANQAHGLCFSVNKGVPKPPSLENIFKELASDVGAQPPSHGSLESWAKQGVLLLNSVLSVESGKPGSHAAMGWEDFTDVVINELNNNKQNLVFLLWGSYAQRKGEKIDINKHLVLKAAHPSPFSVHRGFYGCKHFSLTNEWLLKQNLTPIDWNIL